MTPTSRTPAILAVVAACLGVSACGGDDTGDPIPAGKAERLAQRLDAIEGSVEEGCVSVAAELRAAHGTVATLDDDGVGEDVQDALADGLANLRNVAERDCAAQIEEEPETTPETVPEPLPETTPEPTTPEPTTPEPEPEPEPIPEEPDEEPDEGDGDGQFDPEDGGGAGPPGLEKKKKDEE